MKDKNVKSVKPERQRIVDISACPDYANYRFPKEKKKRAKKQDEAPKKEEKDPS